MKAHISLLLYNHMSSVSVLPSLAPVPHVWVVFSWLCGGVCVSVWLDSQSTPADRKHRDELSGVLSSLGQQWSRAFEDFMLQ